MTCHRLPWLAPSVLTPSTLVDALRKCAATDAVSIIEQIASARHNADRTGLIFTGQQPFPGNTLEQIAWTGGGDFDDTLERTGD